MSESKHTPGAVKAAEIICGADYGSKSRHQTAYGEKTVEGVADIIDGETAAPELLEVVRALLRAPSDGGGVAEHRLIVQDYWIRRAQEAVTIAKAEGGQV